MTSAALKQDTTTEGSSLPIPVWTEQERQPHDPASKQPPQPLVPNDGLHVVVPRKPVPSDDGLQVVVRKPTPEDGLHVVSREDATEQEASPPPPPPPYDQARARCLVLPSRAAEWRVKSAVDRDVRLSTLAAAVLVREGVLDGANVEHLRTRDAKGDAPDEKTPRDPFAALKTSTFSMASEIQRGASEASLRSKRKVLAANERRRGIDPECNASPGGDRMGSVLGVPSSEGDAASSSLDGVEGGETRVARNPNGAEKLDRFAEGVANSGKGFARIVGVGLKAPGVYTHELARGFNNVPRLYGDETVREEDKIVGFTSGLAAAGKSFGYGLYDGIAGVFVQPVKGAQKEGAKGFVKGFVKGIGGVVFKPAAGGFGLAGHTLVGIQKSIEKSVSRQPSEEECIAVASVWQGEEEMKSLTDDEKEAIINAWFAGS